MRALTLSSCVCLLTFISLHGFEAARQKIQENYNRPSCPPIPQRDDLLCSTPTQEPGHCVPLQQCHKLQCIVEVGHAPTNVERELFRRSICGGNPQNVKVCCPVVSMDYCGQIDANKVSGYGGQEACPMEFPWMAMLMYKTGKDASLSPYCGGSLINNRYILTAAHCVTVPPDIVRLGEHDMNKETDCFRDVRNNGNERCAPPVRDFDVQSVIKYPDFDDDPRSDRYLQHDIALIRLNSSVIFTEAVQPICLPFGNAYKQPLTKAKYRLTGWGLTNRTRIPAHALQKITISGVSIPDCVSQYEMVQGSYDKVSIRGTTQLCAGGKNLAGSCKGDSGGPIIYPGSVSSRPARIRMVIYGIVSFGSTVCGVRDLPTVATKVTNYVLWILRNLKSPEEDYRFQ